MPVARLAPEKPADFSAGCGVNGWRGAMRLASFQVDPMPIGEL